MRPLAHLILEIMELPGDDLQAGILNGTLHLGVGYAPQPSNNVMFEPLYRDELVLAVGNKHQLARRKRIRVAALHGQRIAMLNSGETREMLYDYLGPSKAQPLIVAEFNKIPVLLLLASISDIGALAPRRSVEAFPNLNVIALESPAPILQLGLLWNPATRSKVSAGVAAAIRNLVKDPLAIRFEQLGIKGVE